MKNSILKKICAVSLSALMLGCAGAAETSSFIAASLPVYAASVTPASDNGQHLLPTQQKPL